MMLDETLFAAFDVHYLARFRWVTSACSIPTTTWGPGTGRHANLGEQRRMRIFDRDQGRCYLCHLAVDPTCTDGAWAMTIDHRIPLRMGGQRHHPDNLGLAHRQCNLLKGLTPHPTTLYQRDSWRCRRCGERVSQKIDEMDWPWNQPIVEHQVERNVPEIWSSRRAWTCHLRCHSFWSEPQVVPPRQPTPPSLPPPLSPMMIPTCPPHAWFVDVNPVDYSVYERCPKCKAKRPLPPKRYQRCEACRGTGMAGGVRVSYPSPCGVCVGLGRIEVPE